MKTIAILCDGNNEIGYGHIRRALTLAEAIAEKGYRAEIRGISTSPEGIPDKFMGANAADAFVVDSPLSVDAMISELKLLQKPVLALDYFGQASPDRTLSVVEHFKPLPKGQRKSGFEYVLIRPEIRKLRGTAKDSCGYVLVVLGGSDVKNLGGQVAHKLVALGVKPILVEGPLVKESLLGSQVPFQVLRNPPNLAQLMLNCDWAVANGGGCLFELQHLGKAVHVVAATKQEETIGLWAQERGGILGMGFDSLEVPSLERREQVSAEAIKLLDGNGVYRIVSELEGLWNEMGH